MPRITVLQLTAGGHRFRYVRLLAERGPGAVTTLATTVEARASEDFQQHLADLERTGRLVVQTIGSSSGPADLLLRRALDPIQPSGMVIIPDADRLVLPLCRYAVRRRHDRQSLPSLRFLVMRTPEVALSRSRDARVAAGKAVANRALRLCWPGARAFFLTDAWGVVSSRRGYGTAQAVRDPSPGLPPCSREVARAALGFRDGQFVLGLLGAVSARKRPELTVAALRQLPDDVVVLVAGQVAPAVHDVLKLAGRPGPPGASSLRGRMVVRNGYLSDVDLARCVNACDALVLTYDVDAPSGLLVAADEAGVPVVAAGSPWLCRVVTAMRLGVVEDLSVDGVVRGVTALRLAGALRAPRRGTVTGASSTFATALTGD